MYTMLFMNAIQSLSKKCVPSIAVVLKSSISFSGRVHGIEKWDLMSAVCLERKPVVSSPLTPIETKFMKLLGAVEYEKSLKSEHELRKEFDKKQAELLSKGELSEAEAEQAMKQTAQDFEDACQDELTKFQLASRVTEPDKKGDTKSLDRLLDKHLVLVLEQEIGNDKFWLLPQGLRLEGETMRQTAERIIKEKCGQNVKSLFLGNAPCGFYKFKYPKSVRSENGRIGAKVFFFKAWHLSGDVECNNHQWLSRQELSKTLHVNYGKSVEEFLIDE